MASLAGQFQQVIREKVVAAKWRALSFLATNSHDKVVLLDIRDIARDGIRQRHCREGDGKGALLIGLKPALEGAVEDGGKQGVEFGGGRGLEALQGVHLLLQGIQLGDNAALLWKRWIRKWGGFQNAL